MNITYLIDTDWVIHYLHGHTEIVKSVQEKITDGIGLSIVSLAELYEGVHYSSDPLGNEAALHDFLQGVMVIGPDEETCKIFGKERGRLRAQGRAIGDFDLLIGTTALRHRLTLLTNNRRHFEQISSLQLTSIDA